MAERIFVCRATAFAVQQGLDDIEGNVKWWSRSVGVEDKKTAFCFTSSGLFKALDVDSKLGVRPMMYVKADFFLAGE